MKPVDVLLLAALVTTTTLASNKDESTSRGAAFSSPRGKTTGKRTVLRNSKAHQEAVLGIYRGMQARRTKVMPANERNHDNKKHRNEIPSKGSYVVGGGGGGEGDGDDKQ